MTSLSDRLDEENMNFLEEYIAIGRYEDQNEMKTGIIYQGDVQLLRRFCEIIKNTIDDEIKTKSQ